MVDRGGTTPPIYDSIGVGYADVRRPDPRIATILHAALGSGERVLNVGAGTGSYEPPDRHVVAVEPSPAMIRQRRSTAAPVIQAVAENLPFADDAFDAALAVLTVHHWRDPVRGLSEVRRVTEGPVVVLTFERNAHLDQWLVAEYLPEMASLDSEVAAPEEIAEALGGGTVDVLGIPHDCTDGFCHAYWRRPEAYLAPAVRAGISVIARLPGDVVDGALARLAGDLADGSWARRHQELAQLSVIDAGYRIVTSPHR